MKLWFKSLWSSMGKIEFEKSRKAISLSDLETFEAKIACRFPEDYKAHLLKYNGGSPKGECVCFDEARYDDEIELFKFYPLKGKYPSLKKTLKYDEGVLPEHHITIAHTSTGNLCMCLVGPNKGAIYVYYSDAELKFLAPSFSSFVNKLSDLA